MSESSPDLPELKQEEKDVALLREALRVLLGKLGYNQEARVPIILLIDGSLVLLTVIYYYAYLRIRDIHNRLK